VHTVSRVLCVRRAPGASDIHLGGRRTICACGFGSTARSQDIGSISGGGRARDLRAAKVLAGMDIAEHRLPAGRPAQRHDWIAPARFPGFDVPHDSRREAGAARARPGRLRLELAALGMRAPLIDDFREMIRKPEGLILITAHRQRQDVDAVSGAGEGVESGKNITTIENRSSTSSPGPIRADQREAGFTFAKGLRAVLRQDPTSSWSVRSRRRDVDDVD